jgi:hypothetical protein
MEPLNAPSAASPPPALPAATRTETSPTTDQRFVSAHFVNQRDYDPAEDQLEEDSTDVFILEKCSPLNDF